MDGAEEDRMDVDQVLPSTESEPGTSNSRVTEQQLSSMQEIVAFIYQFREEE